jgi:hypothetical protein
MTVKRWMFIVIFILGLTACEGTSDVPDLRIGRQSQTWIDAPLPNSTIPELPYKLMFHGASASGIAEFEVMVNGELITKVLLSSLNINETLFFGEYLWTPGGPGTFLIEVKAIGNEQETSFDQVYVTVRGEEEDQEEEIGEEETPMIAATATPRPITVPTPTNTPESVTGQIKVHLFVDANSNGTQEGSELDYRNIRVSLRPCSCSGRCSESHYANTNDNGNVLFSNLPYGPYCVTTNSGFTPTTTYPVDVNVNSPGLITKNIGYIN